MALLIAKGFRDGDVKGAEFAAGEPPTVVGRCRPLFCVVGLCEGVLEGELGIVLTTSEADAYQDGVTGAPPNLVARVGPGVVSK